MVNYYLIHVLSMILFVFPRIMGGIVAYYLLLIEGGNMLKQLLP